jgi:hypothetical protein
MTDLANMSDNEINRRKFAVMKKICDEKGLPYHPSLVAWLQAHPPRETKALSAPEADPWDKYRKMLDGFIELYANPVRLKELRDFEVYQQLIRETPGDIACTLLVAINRLSNKESE